ncbi:MAG: hypothetical protein ACRCY5_05110 [Phocaeicola sp.]
MKTKVTEDDLKGKIKHFPIHIIQRMCECQVEQGNEFDPSVFASNTLANKTKKGFDYELTIEGSTHWNNTIKIFDFINYLRSIQGK